DGEFHAAGGQVDAVTRTGLAGGIERDGLRRECRFAHVDRHGAGCAELCLDRTGGTVETYASIARHTTLAQQFGQAAHAIATLLHFTAVGVEDAVVRGEVAAARWLQHQRLIETDAAATV